MRIKGVPVRKSIIDKKANTYVDVIRSHRLSKGMTQESLTKKINAYFSPQGANKVSDYERGFTLPDLDKIYLLSMELEIDKDSFFEMILREHYRRFLKLHFENFNQIKNEDRKNIENRYYFCKNGKIVYSFRRFLCKIDLLLKINNKTKKDLHNYLKIYFKSQSSIDSVFSGKKCISTNIVVKIASFFGIHPMEIYEIVVKEKALAHAKNMMKQWEIVKNKYKNVD